MTQPWHYQIRVHLPDPIAVLARTDPQAPAFAPLAAILAQHGATAVSQLDSFEAYVAEAGRNGSDGDPLYRWTVATLADPARRAKHARTFALRLGGRHVYEEAAATALQSALQPLVEAGLVAQVTRHDTNPANNLPVPPQYRG